jgi:hypothetical protein
MKKILNRPEILHGILAGSVLFAAKIILLVSGNWFIRVNTTYNFLAFIVILIAVLMAGNSEKKLRKSFLYFRAWLSAVITIAISVFISLSADQVAYRTKPMLANQVKEFNLEQLHKSLPQLKVLSASTRDLIMAEMEASDPKDLYSVWALISGSFSFIFLNSIWAFIAVFYTRKKPTNDFDTLDV